MYWSENKNKNFYLKKLKVTIIYAIILLHKLSDQKVSSVHLICVLKNIGDNYNQTPHKAYLDERVSNWLKKQLNWRAMSAGIMIIIVCGRPMSMIFCGSPLPSKWNDLTAIEND